MSRYVLVGGEAVVNVHPEDRCAGRPCCIHRPSDHHMRDWPQHWRADRCLMERVCAHGVGHPDPDDQTQDRVHGCDGCCAPTLEGATMSEDYSTGTAQPLRQRGACEEACAFVDSHPTLEAAWSACTRSDWLWWYLRCADVEHRDVVRAACLQARLALPYTTDPRVIATIETVERWVQGTASLDEVRAARSAAWSAARSAARSAAHAARSACADAIRQVWPAPPPLTASAA